MRSWTRVRRVPAAHILYFFFRSWLLAAAGVPALAQSEGEEESPAHPWMLGVAGELDDLGTDSFYATLNWSAAEKTWLYFSGGRSHFENGFGDLTASSFLAGIDHQIGRFGFSVDGEVWGDSAEIESSDLRATAYFGGERHRLYLELESRRIDLSPALPDRPLLSGRINIDVNGTGIGLRARIGLTQRWRLYLRAMSYDYDWATAALPRQDSLLDLCANTLMLVDSCTELRNYFRLLERRNAYVKSALTNNSFVDSEASMNMEWQLGSRLLNFNLTRDRAMEAGGSDSTSAGLSLLLPVGHRMDLELSLGRSESDLFETSTYGGVFFLLYGG